MDTADLYFLWLSVTVTPAVLTGTNGTVPGIATEIYEEQAFDRLPILADTLLDAGCDNEDPLAHCRSDGPHVLGCWAADLILGHAKPAPHPPLVTPGERSDARGTG